MQMLMQMNFGLLELGTNFDVIRIELALSNEDYFCVVRKAINGYNNNAQEHSHNHWHHV